MEIDAPTLFIIEPPRKGARWLFLPTLLLGILATVVGGHQLISGALGEGAQLPWYGALPILACGAFMVVAGAFALTVRSRVTIDRAGGSVHVERMSLVWSRDERHALSLFDRVELREVRRSGSAVQADLVGAFTMVWLVGPDHEVHVSSERDPQAAELAGQISARTELPVVRRP
ncbi:MAG: hypothetical protein DRJ42_27430 [Deltaproteobacteria bacterium]|nr:MAG: hypothetical protein DRJ42_27430 [Deltaproteobacteria bacterium]